jgi:methyltransferase OMS1, mitochondrial
MSRLTSSIHTITSFARQRPYLIVAGGSIYLTTAYLTYFYTRDACCHTNDSHTPNESSYVDNSLYRNAQYDHLAPLYDQKIRMDEFLLGIPLLRRSLILNHARGTVLEVGAGTGRNITWYRNLFPKVNRVLLQDQSNAMLQQAQRKIDKICGSSSRRPQLHVPQIKCLSAAEYPDASCLQQLPSNAFDTVVDTFGLCSYEDPVAVLKEMARVCRKGSNTGTSRTTTTKNDISERSGYILLLEHGQSKTSNWITQYLNRHAENHAQRWGCVWNRDLDAILEQSQLEIVILKKYHFGTTYYVVCRPSSSSS